MGSEIVISQVSAGARFALSGLSADAGVLAGIAVVELFLTDPRGDEVAAGCAEALLSIRRCLRAGEAKRFLHELGREIAARPLGERLELYVGLTLRADATPSRPERRLLRALCANFELSTAPAVWTFAD